MNAAERTVLLAWFGVVLLVLLTSVSFVFGVLGAAGGVALVLPVARARAARPRRTRALARRGVDLRRVGRSVGAHLAVVVVVVLVAALVPGLRDRFVALVVGAVTAGAATWTQARRRQA